MATIRIKRSTSPGSIPVLLAGELAMNLTDRKLFALDNTNTLRFIDFTSDQEKVTVGPISNALNLLAPKLGPTFDQITITNPGSTGDASKFSVKPILLPFARSLEKRAKDTISIRDYGAIGDGSQHPVSEWLSTGLYSSFQAIQIDYPHVTSLTDQIDWAATQAAANALPSNIPGFLNLGFGKLVFNKDVILKPGQATVKGVGSGGTEIRFIGGTKGFTFENAGENDRVHFEAMALSTPQAGTSTAFTISFSGTNSSTQQVLFRDIIVLAAGGYFKYASDLNNVRSPGYNNFFTTGILSNTSQNAPGMLAAHRFRGVTTDIRFNGSFVLGANIGFDIGELCEGLVLNDTIVISVDTGIKANFPNGKPWIQVNGGQIAAYKYGIDGFNIKQLHVVGTTMYAATYDPSRMKDYVGIYLTGTDTRNIFIRGNYFQADGYTNPPASQATTRRAIVAVTGSYAIVVDNQFSGLDAGVVLSAGTQDWRVVNNTMLSVITPYGSSGSNNFYQNTTATMRTTFGVGNYVEDLSGATSAQVRLHDRESAAGSRGASMLFDGGISYHRLLNDDDSVKTEYLTATSERVRLGGNLSTTAALSVTYDQKVYLNIGGVEKLITVGDPDSAGTGKRTLTLAN